MKSDFAKRMEALSLKMSKITADIAEESFKPRVTTQYGEKHRRSYNRYNRQMAFGVSPRIALAVKFGCDPWTLKRWTR